MKYTKFLMISVIFAVCFCSSNVWAHGSIADGLHSLFIRSDEVTAIARYSGAGDGFIFEYNKFGEFTKRSKYEDHRLNGEELLYYRTGELMYKKLYGNGKLDGCSRKYYKDGKLWAEFRYSKGLLEGLTRIFESDGSLMKEAYFKKGRLVAVEIQSKI